MGFQQMSELADRGFIRHRFTAQINPDKLSHGAGIVEGLLHRRVRQVEPLLQTMQPQHAFDTHRRSPWAFGLGLDRLNDRDQFRPRHHPVHLVEKLLTASGLAILLKRDLRKCLLLHGARLQFIAAQLIAPHLNGINQTFLNSWAAEERTTI